MTEMTLLTAMLAEAGIPVGGTGMVEDTTLRIDYLPEATPEQIAQGDAIGAAFNFPVEAARAKKLLAIEAEYQSAEITGVTIPGFNYALATGTENQTEFTKLHTAVVMFKGLGAWTDDTIISILDTKRKPQNISVGQWLQIAPQYTAYCLSSWGAYVQRRAAVMAATTTDQLALL